MGFKKILGHIENKLEEYEEQMDEDEVPPWYGNKEDNSTSSDTDNESESRNSDDGSFQLQETDSEITIQITLPGVPEENIDVTLDQDTLNIDVEGTQVVDNRTYQYDLPKDADRSSIQADYEQGLLVVTVNRT